MVTDLRSCSRCCETPSATTTPASTRPAGARSRSARRRGEALRRSSNTASIASLSSHHLNGGEDPGQVRTRAPELMGHLHVEADAQGSRPATVPENRHIDAVEHGLVVDGEGGADHRGLEVVRDDQGRHTAEVGQRPHVQPNALHRQAGDPSRLR